MWENRTDTPLDKLLFNTLINKHHSRQGFYSSFTFYFLLIVCHIWNLKVYAHITIRMPWTAKVLTRGNIGNFLFQETSNAPWGWFNRKCNVRLLLLFHLSRIFNNVSFIEIDKGLLVLLKAKCTCGMFLIHLHNKLSATLQI